MIKKLICVSIFVACFGFAYGQSPSIQTEKWTDKAIVSAPGAKYAHESAVVLMDKRRIEYADAKNQDVEEYYTLHKLIHINDDKGIESFNKVYLGVNENSDIVDIRARTILPGGKIIEIDRNNIKDVKEEDGNTYKIFAMEGLEKGCDVEFYYTIKKPVSYFGREILQESFPVLNSDFMIIAPDRLKFDVKTYNFSAPVTDTVINSKRIAECSISETPGVEEEKYAAYVSNLERVEFKLSYNSATHTNERIFTWNELAKRIYSIYTDVSDKGNARIADLVSKNGWSSIADEKGKIIAVEAYVKKTFSYDENLETEDGSKLESILQNKVAGTVGIMRLYSAIFKNLGVNFQYVLTCDREKYVIDRGFENWDNCDQPLFYFPAEKKFIAPTRPDFRYPWILPTWGDTNGLFCKQTSIGTFSTAIAEIKTVPLEDYTQSFENVETDLQLSPNLDSLKIDAKLLFAGYPAAEYRNVFNYANDDQKKNLVKEMGKGVAGTDNFTFSEVLNPEFENENTNVPLVVHVKAASDGMIEQAGNKLLLKIGMAIGPQEEMYQEKPRQEPVSIQFPQVEERKINFTIPDGYTIKNPDDLKISQAYMDNGVLTAGFVSEYEIKGNVLTVHVMEQYLKTAYPLSRFDDYRKVINASSDFNKIVLVLEKKS